MAVIPPSLMGHAALDAAAPKITAVVVAAISVITVFTAIDGGVTARGEQALVAI